jgi:beta-fructofuranosidase
LLGSIREDIKVRYWFCGEIFGEYHSFHSDVLLPKGNYAARVVRDNGHWLIYNFYYMGSVHVKRVLPPPKQLETDSDGRLILTSYYRWKEMTLSTLPQHDFPPIKMLLDNPTADLQRISDGWIISSRSGYELFYMESPELNYIWEGTIKLIGLGKCGLMCDVDRDGNGYFIPFDMVNGLVTIRVWGANPSNMKEDFIFSDLQSNLFKVPDDRSFAFRLIRYGHYFELSVNNIVRLTLIDYTFSNPGFGLYSASSEIYLSDSTLQILPEPILEYAAPENPEIN